MNKLPSMEHEFEINSIGSDTQQLFKGVFKYKRPNLGVRRQIKLHEDALNNGSASLDEETRGLNMMLSWLHFTISECPKWWNGGFDMYDVNVIFGIYDEILKFEENFRKKIEDAGKKDES